MFSEEYYNFPYPLFVTSIHMLVQWTMAAITLGLVPRLRPTSRPRSRDYAYVWNTVSLNRFDGADAYPGTAPRSGLAESRPVSISACQISA